MFRVDIRLRTIRELCFHVKPVYKSTQKLRMSVWLNTVTKNNSRQLLDMLLDKLKDYYNVKKKKSKRWSI